MSELETCLITIVYIFHKYSQRDGDRNTLTKNELKELITQELPSFIQCVKDPSLFNSLMESLDTDGDTKCDFQEFLTLIATITICCHEFTK